MTNTKHTKWQITNKTKRLTATTLAALGLASLISGCNNSSLLILEDTAQAQIPPTAPPLPSPTPTSIPPTASPTLTPWPTATPSPTLRPTFTPWPTPTPWPTSTPWSTPAAWMPIQQQAPPTLAPIPLVPTAALVVQGSIPVNYSPPDGVDVFGNTILRWTYYGTLAPDEWFDIKIKPLGSENSAFVDWSKSTEYELRPWSGWTPGLYIWQIGIVKGHKEGETKHFIADTGYDSQPFIIKWQGLGGGGDDGGGGGGNSGGGGGGGSGGS